MISNDKLGKYQQNINTKGSTGNLTENDRKRVPLISNIVSVSLRHKDKGIERDAENKSNNKEV